MISDELLSAGIKAVRAGDLEKASKLFIQVVQTDPHSELGWLWLGVCRTAPEQREYCFHRVLAINPQNAEARRRIESLRGTRVNSQAERPPDPQIRPAPVSTPPPGQPSILGGKTSSAPRKEKTTHQRPSRKEAVLFAWMGAGLALVICFGVAGFAILGRITSLRNVSPPALVVTATAAATPIPNYQPVFEPGQCSFRVPDQAKVTCGFVIVPEDRAGDMTDTIKIAVAIYHAASGAPKPDPILFLQGGP